MLLLGWAVVCAARAQAPVVITEIYQVREDR